MKKIDLLFGLLLGLIVTTLGVYLFLKIKTDFGFIEGIKVIRSEGFLGKLITLGAVLNIALFFLLLQFKKELMARGVVLATILLAIITLLV